MVKRPKLEIPHELIDWCLEVTALFFMIFCIVFTLIHWNQLPERIPTHFNILGEADGYGDKASLLAILPISLLIYLSMTILGRFPNVYNYMVKITEENAERQYRLATRLMLVMKNEILLMFALIQLSILSAARSGVFSVRLPWGPVYLVLIFGTLGYYTVASIRAR